MQIQVYKTADEAGKAAAAVVAAQIIQKPDTVLGLATGSSPIPMYRELIRLYNDGCLDFSRVSSYNLDEYRGLDGTHEQSYRYFMDTQLFDHINISKAKTAVPDGNAPDPDAACAAYDKMISDLGGADIQVLGIGRNGHIGFNEPGNCFIRRCRVVDLTEGTIDANLRFFASRNDVPKQAVSLGIESILAAKQIILIASGKEKAQAVHDMICSDITPAVPATILQAHKNVLVFLDTDAATLM